MTPPMPYETSDTYFAAFLLVAGVPMSGSRLGPEDGKVYFSFENPGPHVVRELKHSYFSGSGVVPALAFSQNLKHLRQIVSGLRRGA
jgi:hypothetical protein